MPERGGCGPGGRHYQLVDGVTSEGHHLGEGYGRHTHGVGKQEGNVRYH